MTPSYLRDEAIEFLGNVTNDEDELSLSATSERDARLPFVDG